MRLNNIGIIGGSGWIGRTIINSLRKAIENGLDFDIKKDLIISNRSGSVANYPALSDIQVTDNNHELISQSDLVVLSVLPQDFNALDINLAGKLVISVMAGVTCDQIKDHTNVDVIVRTMPNAAAEVQGSFTPWYINAPNSQHIAQVKALLSTMGKEQQVDKEDDINIFTAITGSSHGTIAYLQSQMIDAAIEQGVEFEAATQAVKQVFIGMSELMRDRDPHQDVQTVIDYAGTTAALVLAMQEAGSLKTLFDAGFTASYKKASGDMTS